MCDSGRGSRKDGADMSERHAEQTSRTREMHSLREEEEVR